MTANAEITLVELGLTLVFALVVILGRRMDADGAGRRKAGAMTGGRDNG